MNEAPLPNDQLDLVPAVRQIVEQRLAGQQAGHGLDHVLRVYNLSQQIQAEVGGDLLVIQLAALLHDVGDAKFHDGVERSGEFSREILQELGTTAEIVDHVVHIVDNISFRKSDRAQPLSLEGQVVQDADRLDALGAIGIVRTIEFGAMRGREFYVPNDASCSLAHFHDKLFKLRALMNTAVAQRLAGEREQFMRDFLAQFQREWDGARW